mmetsp:Transcript_69517/g.224920  ORF Transcript_69517/g.224920 Transcript_69517/m.224920 type:complete len:429 (-) Transcript_69517:178-1464(-)
MASPTLNHKSELVIFLQRYIGRTLTKDDVVYTVVNVGNDQFQASVKLACLNGEEFNGEPSMTDKQAMQAAAAQALMAFAAEIAAMPPKTKGKQAQAQAIINAATSAESANYKTELVKALQAHSKRTMTKGDVVYTVAKIDVQFQATVRLNCLGGQEFAGEVLDQEKAAEQSAAQQALLANAVWLPAEPVMVPPAPKMPALTMLPHVGVPAVPAKRKDPEPLNPKSELVMFLQRYLRRTMTKEDIVYEHGKNETGFQAHVTLACLEGRQFIGEVCAGQKLSEASAASLALQALQAEVGPLPPAVKKQRQQPGAKPAAVHLGMLGGFVAPPPVAVRRAQVVAPPVVAAGGRQFVHAEALTGEVTDWSAAGWGFIKPHGQISHPLAATREGKVYVHAKDLAPGTELAVGTLVQFRVYADKLGLGAAEVLSF